LKWFLFLWGVLSACAAYSNTADEFSYDAIAQRLMPEGTVNLLGQDKISKTAVIDAARPERGGNEIFLQYCTVCHSTGVAGAPKFGCASAWAERKAKGFQILLQHALNGFHFMPAKGTCLDCSQGEIEDAMHYMINHSTKDDSTCQQHV